MSTWVRIPPPAPILYVTTVNDEHSFILNMKRDYGLDMTDEEQFGREVVKGPLSIRPREPRIEAVEYE